MSVTFASARKLITDGKWQPMLDFIAANLPSVASTISAVKTFSAMPIFSAGMSVGAAQALSGAGAVNVTTVITKFTSTGSAQALTLADGTQTGQLKLIQHTVDGGSGVLTPTHAGNFSTVTFTNVHDWALLQFNGTSWDVVAHGGASIA